MSRSKHVIISRNDQESYFSLVVLNVQSVRHKIDELELFLDSVDSPSILILVEHWLKNNEPINIYNYISLSKFCRSELIHGGTMILLHSEFSRKFEFCNINNFDNLLVERTFEFSLVYCRQLSLYVLALYRSPSGNIEHFFMRLETLLTSLGINANILLCGDLNINFSKASDRYTKSLCSLFNSMNLCMHVDQPTRFSAYSNSTIDYFCSNLNQDYISCKTINAGLSDHEAILAHINLNIRSKSEVKWGRLYTKNNFNQFRQMCDLTDWNSVLNASVPLEHFHKQLTTIFNTAFPITSIKKTKKETMVHKGP